MENYGTITLVGGVNGNYRKRLLNESIPELEKDLNVKIMRQSFDVKDSFSDELTEELDSACKSPYLHAQLYNTHRQHLRLYKMVLSLAKGNHKIVTEFGIDVLARYIEQMPEKNKDMFIDHWIHHMYKGLSFPKQDGKILLLDKNKTKEYIDTIKFIQDYSKRYEKILSRDLNYNFIDVENKNSEKDYKRVKKEFKNNLQNIILREEQVLHQAN